MLIGYARTSTSDQEAGLKAQVRDLRALGSKKVFSEQVSSVGERPELARAIVGLLAAGDGATVVARKLGIARSSVYRIAKGE